jgi:preprotein translocase subunit Sec63
MTSKLAKTIRDVFVGSNFDRKGNLTEMFKVEYRNEYRDMTKNYTNVTDRVVKDYLGL